VNLMFHSTPSMQNIPKRTSENDFAWSFVLISCNFQHIYFDLLQIHRLNAVHEALKIVDPNTDAAHLQLSVDGV
jgi:hypothetical protein